MRFRAALAALLSFILVTETSIVARAGETARDDGDAPPTAAEAAGESHEAPRLTPFWAVAPPGEVDVGARLALASPATGGVLPFGATPKAIMSNNTKTVIIVAIIAGAVLIVVGVIALGKPFGKKP